MSAWIVDKEHIDMMVTAIQRSEVVHLTASADEIGQTLWRENVLSIWARYPDTQAEENYPGPIGFTSLDVDLYHYAPVPLLDVTALANVFRCYAYQSCEHDSWDNSPACAIATQMAEALEAHPDYHERTPFDGRDHRLSGWGVTSETIELLKSGAVA